MTINSLFFVFKNVISLLNGNILQNEKEVNTFLTTVYTLLDA